MKFIAFVQPDARTAVGDIPSDAEMAEMGAFNQQLAAAGVLLALEGLHGTEQATRIDFRADDLTITDGPFTESKELIAGYWILEVKSLSEAKEWMRKAPFRDGSIVIRQIRGDEEIRESHPELYARRAKFQEELAQRQAERQPG